MKTPVSRLSALFCLLLVLVAACKKDPDPVVAKSSAKALSSFTFGSLSPAVVATVSGNTVMATVPFGTNVTALAPTISLSDKATVSPASGVAQNFSNSVNYTVTAEDGSTQVYAVAVGVGVAPKSMAKDITAFTFNGITPAVNCTIDAVTKVISGTLPAGTDATKLVPTISLSPKATVTPATGVMQDFSKEVVYTVTAEDASTVVYKVNVTKQAVVAVEFLWDYTKIPTVEKPNPTTLLIKGITVKSAPTLSATNTYWYSYYHPVKQQTIYIGSLREASDFSFNIEVKDLLPNRTYDIKYEIASYNCDASKDGPTCDKNTFIRIRPKNDDANRNKITAKTSDFLDNSDNTINSYKNVRIYVSKDTPNLEDSCLIDLKNGKVFPLKDGAKNAANIDVYLTYIDIFLKFYSPEISYSSDNKLYPIIKAQKWSIYKETTFSYGSSLQENLGYTSLANWNKIINTSDINKFKFAYESSDLVFGRTYTDGTLYESPSDNLLIGFKTKDGKMAIARLKETIGTSKGHLLILDIKIQK